MWRNAVALVIAFTLVGCATKASDGDYLATGRATSSTTAAWALPGSTPSPIPVPSSTETQVVESTSSSDNDDTFIDAIRGDGITLERNEAILQGHALCLFVEPPNGGSLFDAGQQVEAMHPDWGIVGATHFVDRSVQNYCPDRTP